MHLSLPRRRPGVDDLMFQKSRQEAVVSVSGSQEGMESHGRINSRTHSSSLSPAGSSGRFGRVKGSTHTTSAKLWNQVSMHRTLRPLLGPPRARSLRSTLLPYRGYVGWSDWSRLYSVWVPGSCPAVSLAPVDHLTWLCDSVRLASSQVQGHTPHSSEGS